MIIRVEELKEVCSNILPAVDANEISSVTETLELVAENKTLTMSVTNREYYVTVKMNIDTDEKFVAAVNANLFLKLISQTTTETIELKTSGSTLIIKGNGTYKIPMICDESGNVSTLPVIKIENITEKFTINSEILNSILEYNTKQISVGTLSRPVQKMFYVDGSGAITFTSGACINNFKLDKDVKMLLSIRLVKLFKLFKEGVVDFAIGHDVVNGQDFQTKVQFQNKNIVITAILPFDDTMLSSVPVSAIRSRANSDYPYSVNIDKQLLIDIVERMKLFVTTAKGAVPYAKFEFNKQFVKVSDTSSDNIETLYYNNDITNIDEPYTCYFDLVEVASILDTCKEKYIVTKFGDNQAIAICRSNIVNIIPEVRME